MPEVSAIDLVPQAVVLLLLGEAVEVSKLQYDLYNACNRVNKGENGLEYFLCFAQRPPVYLLPDYVVEEALQSSHQIRENGPDEGALEGYYSAAASLPLEIEEALSVG